MKKLADNENNRVSEAITIRKLLAVEDMLKVQKLEKLVWEMEPIPVHQTITAAQNGGLLLGAFIGEELVGFSYGFAGFGNGQTYLCSHMLGIHPLHQEKGIGARLKKAQLEMARSMGYELLVWTYDPLETRNGYLNLSKLNAICSVYAENCYGEMDDSLNHSLPTDRFKVEWWINSPHVTEQQAVNAEDAQSPFEWETTEAGLPILASPDKALASLDLDKPVLVPAPSSMQQLKCASHELALDWRLKTRLIFQTLFKKGYTAADVLKSEAGPVHHYVLVKRETVGLKKGGNDHED